MAALLRMGVDPQVAGATCSIPGRQAAEGGHEQCGIPLEPGQWHPGVCKHGGASQHKQVEA
eukprot:2249361-Lingulodinium_polyedra.AAC.1